MSLHLDLWKKSFVEIFLPFMYNLLAQSIVHKKMHHCDHLNRVKHFLKSHSNFVPLNYLKFFILSRIKRLVKIVRIQEFICDLQKIVPFVECKYVAFVDVNINHVKFTWLSHLLVIVASVIATSSVVSPVVSGIQTSALSTSSALLALSALSALLSSLPSLLPSLPTAKVSRPSWPVNMHHFFQLLYILTYD